MYPITIKKNVVSIHHRGGLLPPQAKKIVIEYTGLNEREVTFKNSLKDPVKSNNQVFKFKHEFFIQCGV